jgi:hypothetical protein
MLSHEEAIESAKEFLKKVAYPEKAESVVMLPEKSVHYPWGWTVCFDFQEHLETGEFTAAPFTSVIVVPHDGTQPHFPPTYLPVTNYMELQASGEWPHGWPPRNR